jgi:hypothetical protein
MLMLLAPYWALAPPDGGAGDLPGDSGIGETAFPFSSGITSIALAMFLPSRAS